MVLSTVDYYFDTHDSGTEWETGPEDMVDGSILTFAKTTINDDDQLCTGNTCVGTDLGHIMQVQLRAYGVCTSAGSGNVQMIPKFRGTTESSVYDRVAKFDTIQWSSYFDITNIDGAPTIWAWSDIRYLDTLMTTVILGDDVRVYKIEIHVIYSPLRTEVYSQGKNSLVTLSTTINASEKLHWGNLLRNAGRVGIINVPSNKIIHYDTTTDSSNTITFPIYDNPTGIPSSLTLFIQNYSIKALVPNVTYQLRIQGYSE